jgi:hypothetical protein
MAETVTSKLTSQYFTRLLGVVGFWAFLILMCKNDGLNDQQSGVPYICVSLFCVLLVALIFLVSPPKKIIVSKENITIKNYITGRQIVILYADIDRTNIIAAAPNTRSRGRMQYRRFQIILKNKTVISFNSADYDNYDSLKAAIYDHAFRGL